VSSETPAAPAAAGPAAASPPAGTEGVLEIPPASLDGRLDLRALFGDDRPVELEIGSGKGRFLIEQAAARPDTGFLGVEWSLKYLRLSHERARKRGVVNVRLLRADARHVVVDLLPDAALRRVHVYCPDPWPKKRHHKRRFFAAATVPHLERVLEPGGYLHVSTDVADYFADIGAALRERTGLAEAEDPLFPAATAAGRTSYEIKYLAAGREIHRACYRRVRESPR
jgi:tRNA (guanine-N7-)-methyltransferase